MKARVVRKVLKRARQGCRYRLSTFRQARRWERRHRDPWKISVLARAWEPLAQFTIWMEQLWRSLARRLGIPDPFLRGENNYSSQASQKAPVSKTGAGER